MQQGRSPSLHLRMPPLVHTLGTGYWAAVCVLDMALHVIPHGPLFLKLLRWGPTEHMSGALGFQQPNRIHFPCTYCLNNMLFSFLSVSRTSLCPYSCAKAFLIMGPKLSLAHSIHVSTHKTVFSAMLYRGLFIHVHFSHLLYCIVHSLMADIFLN